MSRGVDCAELEFLPDLTSIFEREVLDEAFGKLAGTQWASVSHKVSITGQELGVLEANFFLLRGSMRKIRTLNSLCPTYSNRAGSLAFADDVFVDFSEQSLHQKARLNCKDSVDFHFEFFNSGIQKLEKEMFLQGGDSRVEEKTCLKMVIFSLYKVAG